MSLAMEINAVRKKEKQWYTDVSFLKGLNNHTGVFIYSVWTSLCSGWWWVERCWDLHDAPNCSCPSFTGATKQKHRSHYKVTFSCTHKIGGMVGRCVSPTTSNCRYIRKVSAGVRLQRGDEFATLLKIHSYVYIQTQQNHPGYSFKRHLSTLNSQS